MRIRLAVITTSVLLAVSSLASVVQAAPERDRFFWFTEMNKASVVINAQENY